jgi:hypothetical protein
MRTKKSSKRVMPQASAQMQVEEETPPQKTKRMAEEKKMKGRK